MLSASLVPCYSKEHIISEGYWQLREIHPYRLPGVQHLAYNTTLLLCPSFKQLGFLRNCLSDL